MFNLYRSIIGQENLGQKRAGIPNLKEMFAFSLDKYANLRTCAIINDADMNQTYTMHSFDQKSFQ